MIAAPPEASLHAHRSRTLDALRALAVLLVLGFHGGYLGGGLPQPLAIGMHVWNRIGWAGVDLFFVLSGFLVSGLLFREFKLHGRVQGGRFLARRGLKIYPAFYVYLAVVIATLAASGVAIDLRTVLSEALFVQNYGPRFLVHTWSLAVEEHFYLLVTLVVVAAGARVANRRSVSIACLAIAVGALVARVVASLRFGVTSHLHDATQFRIDALTAGLFLAYLYQFEPAAFRRLASRRAALAVAGVILIIPAVLLRFDDPWLGTVGLTTTYAAFAALLLLAVDREPTTRLLGPTVAALAVIGRYSYSMYLWHLPVRIAMLWAARRVPAFPATGGLGFVTFVALSVVVGILMAKAVELPVLRLRDRYFPSRTGLPTG
ncbi:MAG TPA: acyltransferase [Vicinamibacterales bacterium]|nr:acyltransferase [Vicinamibacterales bacterium]